jgi:multidrug resistance efflux pump
MTMIRKYGLPLLALGLLGFAVFHVVRGQQTPPPLEPPIQPAHAPDGAGVAGAGLVEARTENIAVGSNLPGVVTEVYVKVGQRVYKGDKLFRLDDRALAADRKVKHKSLESAKAQLAKLDAMPRQEEVPALEARVREAKSNLADQQDLLQRSRRLLQQRAIADEEHNRRDQAARMAREQLRKAEADLALMKAGAWGPDKEVARASVEMAQAQLSQVETDLERLTVTALVDGEVLQVNVRPGEYVNAQAGTALVVLGDVGTLHVRVDVDEHDVPRFEPGAAATAYLRGDPRQKFDLKFVRVEPYVIPKKSLTGDNTERVDTRVLQVIYAVEPTQGRLYVGQQLDVYVVGRRGQKGK